LVSREDKFFFEQQVYVQENIFTTPDRVRIIFTPDISLPSRGCIIFTRGSSIPG
jgi:hypothetical protein